MKILLYLLITTCTMAQDTISFRKLTNEDHSEYWEATESKYKPGFQYYDQRMSKVTLSKWVNVTPKEKIVMGTPEFTELINKPHYRWEATFEMMGVTAKGYTDDLVIDIALGKLIVWQGQTYEPIKVNSN